MGLEGDVLIVGGGVAGLAAATALGAEGRRVLVVDKAALPRDKVCGEGIMPAGLALLRDLGVEPRALAGAWFRGIEYRGVAYRGRRRAVPLDFPAGVQGRGVRRTELIAMLHRATLAHGSVTHHADAAREPLWQDGRIVGVRGVRDDYRARVVLAADGAHAGLAQRAGAELRPYGERMGLRRHYRLAPGIAVPRVIVGLYAPYDVYLTPEGDGTLIATTMTHRVGYRALRGRYDAFLREGPCRELFAGARALPGQRGWHHPLCAPRRYNVGGMMLLGDAGGGVDPCLGMGVSLALASARSGARAAAGLLTDPGAAAVWLQRFEAERRALFRHYHAFGRVMRAAVTSRVGSAVLLYQMRHWPAVAESLLDIVARGTPWREFAWGGLLEPLRPGGRRLA